MCRVLLSSRAVARARVVGLLVIVGMLVAPSVVFAQAETIEYYGTDTIGSIRIVWDASGNMTARQDFTPFGEPVLQQGTAIPKEGFVGNETDAETNQDYFHARLFEARTGRFTRTDPIENGVADPQQWNRYAYGRNNPVSITDVNGLNAEDPGDCPSVVVNGITTGDCRSNPITGSSNSGGGWWSFLVGTGDPTDALLWLLSELTPPPAPPPDARERPTPVLTPAPSPTPVLTANTAPLKSLPKSGTTVTAGVNLTAVGLMGVTGSTGFLLGKTGCPGGGAAVGGYGSGGFGAGAEGSVQIVQVGFYKEGVAQFRGGSVSLNVGLGNFSFSLTFSNQKLVGGSIGYGYGLGFSATASGTGVGVIGKGMDIYGTCLNQ